MAADRSDVYYLGLKGIRERACAMQCLVDHDAHRADLQTVCDIVDRLGVFYAPSQWSKHDEPEIDYGPQFDEGDV